MVLVMGFLEDRYLSVRSTGKYQLIPRILQLAIQNILSDYLENIEKNTKIIQNSGQYDF